MVFRKASSITTIILKLKSILTKYREILQAGFLRAFQRKHRETMELVKKNSGVLLRLCMTKLPENRVPKTKPDGYDSTQYELLGRVAEAGRNEYFNKYDPIPNLKTDVNNHGLIFA